MPSMKSRAKPLPQNYIGRAAPAQSSAPDPMPTPQLPQISYSPTMISSLPGIAATLDGPQKQFYSGNLPTRRVNTP